MSEVHNGVYSNLSIDGQLAQLPWGTVRVVADYVYTGSYFTNTSQIARSGPDFDPGKSIAGDTKVDSVDMVDPAAGAGEYPAGGQYRRVRIMGAQLDR